jgi:hypothetical protein
MWLSNVVIESNFMNRKGFDISISTIVIIVISIVVLAGLVFLFTKGIGLWNAGVEPLGNSANRGAVIEACNLACTTEDLITFCCERFSVNEGKVLCTDSALGIDCSISCVAVSCPVD